LRVKGESYDELRGFLLAAQSRLRLLRFRASDAMPVVIPTYNGARRAPNLVPLLALALRARGIPVLVHGVLHDQQRVTTAAILQALGIAPCSGPEQAQEHLRDEGLAFIPIEGLSSGLAHLLALRWQLGVRNSAHTVSKMIQPMDGRALQLVSVTHPDYLRGMREYFTACPADVMLLRGTEGEAVASTRRPQAIEWLREGTSETVVQAVEGSVTLPDLPATIDAPATAEWIRATLTGQHAVPQAIEAQLAAIERIVRR
jgi:anthranilate phosphoribosyltransferase